MTATTPAQATFDVYTRLGVLADCVGLSTRKNHGSGRWEIWGSYQNSGGRRTGKVAEFEAVEDAVDFVRLAGF